MSSFAASANLSTETASSSLLRSGLNISVGDTKSIVLALQALQGKIRALEQDRDLHKDQYERILQAHESYKIDMEHQLERERAAHRRREEELLELLHKAHEEKSRMEGSLSGNQSDLTAFRKEIQDMIESEKNMAKQRELKLQNEITRLQQEIGEERARYNTLLDNVERLKGERNAIEEVNHNLRDAVHALRNPPPPRQQQQRLRLQGRGGPARVSNPPHRGGGPPRVSSAAPKEPALPPSRAYPARHNGYEEPTCNSRLRDARNALEEGSCICDKANLVGESSVGNTPRQNSSFAGFVPQRQGRSSSAQLRIRVVSRDASVLPQHPLSYRKFSPSPSARAHGPGSRRNADGGGSAPPSYPSHLTTGRGAREDNISIDEVEKQIDEELEELQKEYQSTISRAKVEKPPRHVVSETLKRISSHIDRKMEQLSLLRAARREIGSSRTPAANGDATSADHTIADKQVQRNRLVNELRSMLAQSAEKQ